MADRDRFPELSESEWTSLLDQKNSDNTKKATKVALNVFRDYLKERKIDEDSLVASKDKLATVLRKFYAEARKKNGELYTKASLVGTRFGLQRFFSSHRIDVIKGPEFSTQHKPAINKHDIKKLYESGLFSLTQPETLQNKVFFQIMLFFCRRGRQNLRELKMEDFSISTNSSGVRFVCKVKDELTKNRREND